MKYAILNGDLIDNQAHSLIWQNRAFQFGDGFFETILYANGEVKFFNRHFIRIKKAIQILGFDDNHALSEISLKREIQLLCHINSILHCRVKIIFWRNWGGLYSPENQTYNYLILTYPLKVSNAEPITKIGVSKKVYNTNSITSGIKTLSSLKYVLAGKEKLDNDWEEIILVDEKNNVSEALHSNLICVKNGIFFTPSDQSGCVQGVMRSIVIETILEAKQKVKQELFNLDFLLNSESIYLCNISGIRRVGSWNGNQTFEKNELLENLTNSIFERT